jgi:hypothetical protein
VIDRPRLVALPGYGELPRTDVEFCGHCGRPPHDVDIRSASRVCARCGMGLMVSAPAEAAPAPDDPFVIVDGQLTVCGVSRHAESLMQLRETEAVNRHVSELLVPADIEIAGPESLINLVVDAARGEGEVHHVVLRPSREFGIRFWARICPCGPARAALIVLADGR